MFPTSSGPDRVGSSITLVSIYSSSWHCRVSRHACWQTRRHEAENQGGARLLKDHCQLARQQSRPLLRAELQMRLKAGDTQPTRHMGGGEEGERGVAVGGRPRAAVVVSAGAPQTCCHGWTLTTVLSSCSEARHLVLWSALTTEWAPWDRSPGPRTPVTPSVYHAIEHLPPGRRKSHVDAQTNEWVQHPALSTVRVSAHLWTRSGTGRACEQFSVAGAAVPRLHSPLPH